MAPIHRLSQLSSHLAVATTAASNPRSRLSSLRNYTASTTASDEASATYKVTRKDRAFYPYALDIQSRWADNDQYGHLNNAHYYSLFDTVINAFLIQEAGLDPLKNQEGSAIGVVATSGCDYYSSLSYPDMIEARLAVTKLGRTSVVYRVGIFKKLASAETGSTSGSTVPEIVTTRGSSPSSAGVFSRSALSASLRGPTGPSAAEGETRAVFHPSQIQADAAASGHFCHVFVDQASRRPTPIPAAIRSALELLQVNDNDK
ncbi:hypothetical protein BGZ70_000202 [Mortierella alpina]|uniref:Thioesterase domain-containing protein n=1 Tax=Mortierella alpina TaxID=64518 RepID=A0A9P6LZA8_MORAP|nr:hypothetical protein BGZ70_000202 [Mortierella alpina]